MPTPAEIILAKAPLPTHLDSTEIRERWTDDVRRRSLFSARTTEIGYLRRLQAVLAQVAGGEINNADARLALLEQLDALGYTPEEGFPGDAKRGVPPASGLADLSGRRRLDLIINTQREKASSAALIARQTPAELEMFPAWRLERYVGKAIPRDDWSARWQAAGSATGWDGALQGIMVALKASPIWAALGRGVGGFTDALGDPYPPFAYSSGLNWSPVSSDECRRLGLHVATADAPEASLRPGEKEIADALGRFGPEWTDALMKDLEAA